MVSGRPLRAGTGTGYDGRVRAWGTVVPVVPKKGHQINKNSNRFLQIGHLSFKIGYLFFGVQMMGTTGTTRGGTSVPYHTLKSVPTVPWKVYQPYPTVPIAPDEVPPLAYLSWHILEFITLKFIYIYIRIYIYV